MSARTSRLATLMGFGAILLWAILAALTTLAGPIPPFQLTALTFAIGTLVGVAYAKITGQSFAAMRDVPSTARALGVYGLFLFHACYFFALQRAPALEASLIVYLWPLLIVVFSGFLPPHVGGADLCWWHYAGAALGFAGAALILLGSEKPVTFSGSALGYLLALAAAFIWSSYSVASRLFAAVPSVAVTGACALTALGALVLHSLLETWVQPASLLQWLGIVGLGLGPTGLAFYIWDEAMKHGDMRLLGVASYATPLLSTLVLTGLGQASPGPALWFAAALIAGGALLAGKDKFVRNS